MMTPELTVVIPTLNEAATLPGLLDDLAAQQTVVFELIVVDGGSVDETVEVATSFLDSRPEPGEVLVTEAGRGRQLNRGADRAQAEWLLFLHADSRLTNPNQLRQALDLLVSQAPSTSGKPVAGRFLLKFDLPATDYSLGYYFYETKARLNRPGCIHGDQGFLLHRTTFELCGPFREDLPVMEDTWLANKLLASGHWLLLPDEVLTSARRFQVEGLKERQTLNALLMNFLDIGWLDFFREAPQIYRDQKETGRLDLSPFFRCIQELLQRLPRSGRRALWLATGRYVCGQVWQLGLYLDCHSNYRRGSTSTITAFPWLRRFDRWVAPLVNHRFGGFCTALLVRIWFVRQTKVLNPSVERVDYGQNDF